MIYWIEDDIGQRYGPYDNYQHAICDAERVDGIVIEIQETQEMEEDD